MGPDRVGEALHHEVRALKERELLAQAKLSDHMGHQDLTWVRRGAKTGSELDACSEQIASITDGFSCCDSYAHLNPLIRMFGIVGREALQNVDYTFHATTS